MADWPLLADGCRMESLGGAPVGYGVYGRPVLTPTTPDTKSTPPTVLGTTTFDSSGLILNYHYTALNTAHKCFADILVGSTVLIENVMFETGPGRGSLCAPFPIGIPAGTVVSVSAQSTIASQIIFFSLSLYSGGFSAIPPAGRITTYGVTTNPASGVAPDATVSLTAKGEAWSILSTRPGGGTTLIADTSQIIIAAGNAAAPQMWTAVWLLDVALGASPTTDTVVLPDIPIGSHITSDQLGTLYFGPFPFSAPADSTVKIRLLVNTSKHDEIEFAMYGIS